uniref:Secreted protein n=1 Tax=Anopheles farauti TaxID=69004 RepID=A0A182Q451_9DIPT
MSCCCWWAVVVLLPVALAAAAAATAVWAAVALSAGSRFWACAWGCELTTLTGEMKVNGPLKLPAPAVPITCLPVVVVSICGVPWKGFEAVISWNCCWPPSGGITNGCVPYSCWRCSWESCRGTVACCATCAGLWDFSSVSGRKSYGSSNVMPAFSASVSRHLSDERSLPVAGGTVPLPVRTIVVVPFSVRTGWVVCCTGCSRSTGDRELWLPPATPLPEPTIVIVWCGDKALGAVQAAAGDCAPTLVVGFQGSSIVTSVVVVVLFESSTICCSDVPPPAVMELLAYPIRKTAGVSDVWFCTILGTGDCFCSCC